MFWDPPHADLFTFGFSNNLFQIIYDEAVVYVVGVANERMAVVMSDRF